MVPQNITSGGSCTQRCGLGTARPLTYEALTTDARLLLLSLDSGLHAKKVEPLGSNYTGSNRPIGVLECNNEGRV